MIILNQRGQEQNQYGKHLNPIWATSNMEPFLAKFIYFVIVVTYFELSCATSTLGCEIFSETDRKFDFIKKYKKRTLIF